MYPYLKYKIRMNNLFLYICIFFCILTGKSFSETIPAAPTKYFDDRLNIINKTDSSRLNEELAGIEKNNPDHPQFVISILKFDSDSSLEDYTNRIAKQWKVGQKDINNGLILFWFPDKHKLRFETGYGMEAVLPDILCRRILINQIIPQFKNKNYVVGLENSIKEVSKYISQPELAKSDIKKSNLQTKTNNTNAMGIIILSALGLLVVIFLFSKGLGGIIIDILLCFVNVGGSNKSGGGFSSSGGNFGGGGSSGYS